MRIAEAIADFSNDIKKGYLIGFDFIFVAGVVHVSVNDVFSKKLIDLSVPAFKQFFMEIDPLKEY